jgi:hypothetical protein
VAGPSAVQSEQRAEYRVEPNYIVLVAGDVMTFLGWL